jgi:glutaminyl-tRNA synthetase
VLDRRIGHSSCVFGPASGLARVVPDTKSGTPGADAVKVKGTIGWVGVHEGIAATVNHG